MISTVIILTYHLFHDQYHYNPEKYSSMFCFQHKIQRTKARVPEIKSLWKWNVLLRTFSEWNLPGDLLKLLFYSLCHTKVQKWWNRVVHAENDTIVEKWYRKNVGQTMNWYCHCDTKTVYFFFTFLFASMEIPSKYYILTTWNPW